MNNFNQKPFKEQVKIGLLSILMTIILSYLVITLTS
ncbi:protein of unknown function [Tenacibaculum jejuense]|uniref:Uncharacterized protein n=1 Tax=Tenacibaculum jejuense TaxID=584609 RepID=A0A238UF54_9FLAO|nr:protein of unknown function [Tenacibaculum jejuense]